MLPCVPGRRNVRVWAACAALAIPSVLWPLLEWAYRPAAASLFLPFLNQIDIALPLSWMVRLGSDPSIADLCVWEHRHTPGSPMALCFWWPTLYAIILKLAGTPAAYWGIVFALHTLWLRAAMGIAVELLGPGRRAWPVAAAFVYLSLPLSLNLYQAKWNLTLWSVIPFYENYRGFPSATALAWSTFAVWRLLVARRVGDSRSFLVAGLCVAITVYGRPFDWMMLVTFVGLSLLLSVRERKTSARPSALPRQWGIALAASVAGALPFLVRYALWMRAGTAVYEAQLARGVLQGKAPIHFLKYGFMAAAITGALWCALRLAARRAAPRPLATPAVRAFWATLVAASFLPYFQFLPNGKTPSSFQYFFIYFSLPFAWMGILCAAASIPARTPPSLAPAGLALGLGLASQLALLATPGWMVRRVEFDRSQQPLYDTLRLAGPDAVVLCPSITDGSSQQLILRAGAWSFVPHPMMYGYGSLASNPELVERQLLAKLLLTGTIADVAPLFSEGGLPAYARFYSGVSPETRHWLDRLENCPARAFFLFDPEGSREDFRLRGLAIPPPLLKEREPFAWFGPSERQAFRSVAALEGLPPSGILAAATRRYRLTHLLLTPDISARFPPRAERLAGFTKIAETPGGASLWRVALQR